MGRKAPDSGVSGSPYLASLPSPECLLFQRQVPWDPEFEAKANASILSGECDPRKGGRRRG